MTSQDATTCVRPLIETPIAISFPFVCCVGPAIAYSCDAANLALLLSADPGVIEFRCLQPSSDDLGHRPVDFEVTTRDEIVLVTATPVSIVVPGVITITPNQWPSARLGNVKTLAQMANSSHSGSASMRLAALLADCEYVTVGEAAAVIGVPDPFGVIAYLFFNNAITLRIDDEPLSPSTKLAGPAVDSVVERIIEEAGR